MLKSNEMPISSPNISKELQPLYDAIRAGKTIKKIIFIDKFSKKRNIASIRDFKIDYYTIGKGSGWNEDLQKYEDLDYVDIVEMYIKGTDFQVKSNAGLTGFYMSWVKSFKI